MTDIYLAFSASGESRATLAKLQERTDINVLVSFVYLDKWDNLEAKPVPAKTILDSGAYSAWKSGATIDIDKLIEETKQSRWNESVSLDVIGDVESSLKNALYMKKRGSPAYPVFHYGEPWKILAKYCGAFPKVGLSCRFGETVTDSLCWLDQCFARAWPHKFHSFGWVKRDMLERFPFHSADTASWNNRPCAFGRWAYCGKLLSVYGQKDLRAEVDFYLKLQRDLQQRWKRELDKLN